MGNQGITRRGFLLGGGGGAAALVGLAALKHYGGPGSSEVTGMIRGGSVIAGHRLRGGHFPAPSTTISSTIVLVGGGIAGLSAAWKLHQSGVRDFLLLELEHQTGGTANCGENAVSAYPWGAHYIPLLTEEAKTARELFADLGIIQGYQNGLPVYNDYYLCADPQERLYMLGRWHEGLVPQLGITARDKAQYATFFQRMESYKELRGQDGKRVFAIPIDLGSTDAKLRQLDRISMAAFMQQEGWDSPYLTWYVNYCCRDDYGATMDQVSAWAGIHFFAARNGRAANADAQAVLTWPEGNGWIVRQLHQRFQGNVRTNALVFAVRPQGEEVEISFLDLEKNATTLIQAKAVILATPRFIARRLLGEHTPGTDFSYSPWMVANITLDALPEGRGAPLGWDNVIYDSPMLGYVVATHQKLERTRRATVLSYYWPLSHLSPGAAREEALGRTYGEWRDMVLKELLRVHPELHGHVKQLDVWLWGHGMIRPTPGFIWGAARQQALADHAPLYYAHSDQSGIAIFEEANYHGIKAAERVMNQLGHPYQTSL